MESNMWTLVAPVLLLSLHWNSVEGQTPSQYKEGSAIELLDTTSVLMQVHTQPVPGRPDLQGQKKDASSSLCGPGNQWGDWRRALPQILSELQLDSHGDIYEFGVYNGESMRMLQGLFPNAYLWGFDSFKGLPAQTPEDLQQHGYTKGMYAASTNPAELLSMLGGASKAEMIVGFYNETLTHTLPELHGMKQALYVDIDADLYSSTTQALDWLFKRGLVREGTLIGYDDWWVNACSPGGEHAHPLLSSEGLAHKEIADKHFVKFRCVNGGCNFSPEVAQCPNGAGAIFIVESIGEKDGVNDLPRHGFEMNARDVAKWTELNPWCQYWKSGGDDGGPQVSVRQSSPHAENPVL